MAWHIIANQVSEKLFRRTKRKKNKNKFTNEKRKNACGYKLLCTEIILPTGTVVLFLSPLQKINRSLVLTRYGFVALFKCPLGQHGVSVIYFSSVRFLDHCSRDMLATLSVFRSLYITAFLTF